MKKNILSLTMVILFSLSSQAQESCESTELCIIAGHIIQNNRGPCIEPNPITFTIPHQFDLCDVNQENCTPRQENVLHSFSCPEGKTLCNPLVFGYRDLEPNTRSIDSSQTESSHNYNFAAYCVDPDPIHPSQSCYFESIADKAHRNISVKYNPEAWQRYQDQFAKLCKKDGLDCFVRQFSELDDTGQIISTPPSISRAYRQKRDLCDWANFRLSQETGYNGERESRFLPTNDPARMEPQLGAEPRRTREGIESPYPRGTIPPHSGTANQP